MSLDGDDCHNQVTIKTKLYFQINKYGDLGLENIDTVLIMFFMFM